MNEFDPHTHARNTDPATSHAAARSLGDAHASMMRKLLRHFVETGPLTVEEAGDLLGVHRNDASKRVSDLKNEGWIEDSGDVRQARTRRWVIVWQITDAGRSELGAAVR